MGRREKRKKNMRREIHKILKNRKRKRETKNIYTDKKRTIRIEEPSIFKYKFIYVPLAVWLTGTGKKAKGRNGGPLALNLNVQIIPCCPLPLLV